MSFRAARYGGVSWLLRLRKPGALWHGHRLATAVLIRAAGGLHASAVARVICRRRGAPRRAAAVVRRRMLRAINIAQNVRAPPLQHGPRRRRMAAHRLASALEGHVLEVRAALPLAPHASQAALIPARTVRVRRRRGGELAREGRTQRAPQAQAPARAADCRSRAPHPPTASQPASPAGQKRSVHRLCGKKRSAGRRTRHEPLLHIFGQRQRGLVRQHQRLGVAIVARMA